VRARIEKEDPTSALSDSVDENSRLLDTLSDIMENQLGISKADQFLHEAAAETGGEPGVPSLPVVKEPAEEKDAESPLKYNQLLKFFLAGIKPVEKPVYETAGQLTPVLLYPYRDLSKIRYDYPLCLLDKPGEQWVVPLKTIFDKLINEAAPPGDEGAHFTRALLNLESKMKALAEKGGAARLSELWDNAVKSVIKESRSKNQKQDITGEHLSAAREALTSDGIVVPCEPDTLLRLLEAAENIFWREKVRKYGEEIHDIISRLRDMLKADETKSPEASAAEGLKASLGVEENELDFDAFSDILSQSALPETMPEERRQRITRCLESLEAKYEYFLTTGNGAVDKGKKAEFTWVSQNFTESAREALDKYREQMAALLKFFKSVRIARLELENRYREESHDPFFREFGREFLSEEELSLFPPILLSLNTGKLSAEDKGHLVEILSSEMPLKILLRVDDLFVEAESGYDPSPDYWAVQLAKMALNLSNAFVLQTGYSNVSALAGGFMKGLHHDGPALYAIYTGENAQNQIHLADYMQSAAALESRVFPAFIYHPEGGRDWALRFSVEPASQFSQTWPVSDFVYQTADEKEATLSMEFTYADFLSIDRRFGSLFWAVPRSAWNDKMVPLGEYLLQTGDSEDKLPYILMADEKGILWRVLLTRRMVELTRKAAADWRSLQELGGINNSHALKLLDREKKRLEEEMQQQVEEVKAEHEAKMAQTVEELTREIVSKIAAGLLSEGVAAQTPAMPAVSVPSPEKAATPAAEAVEETPAAEAEAAEPEEEEEALSFDEPYVDTPLCTSCNDCTNINNKMFAYNENKQAYIKDAAAGTYRELVQAAEKCPVHIIHPGKPKNPGEPGLDELIKRAEKYN
jgi:ferredoxin